MRIVLAAATIMAGAALVGCATAPSEDTRTNAILRDPNLGDRIDRICSLPQAEREAELEKLKVDGLVLHCGNPDEGASSSDGTQQDPAGAEQSGK